MGRSAPIFHGPQPFPPPWWLFSRNCLEVRRGRLLMVSPDSRDTACPLSARNSTYRPAQISGTGSVRSTLSYPVAADMRMSEKGVVEELQARLIPRGSAKRIGECGIYSYEVAEAKVTQVMDFAQTPASSPMRDGKEVTRVCTAFVPKSEVGFSHQIFH
jgi:hypothetical protein